MKLNPPSRKSSRMSFCVSLSVFLLRSVSTGIKISPVFFSCVLFFAMSFFSPSVGAVDLDELLKKVKEEGALQSVELKKREARFLKEKELQKSLLKKAQRELTALEREGVRLGLDFEKNEKLLSKKEEELLLVKGSLGEMFGVVKQVAGDLRGQLDGSVVSAQIQGRKKFVSRLAESQSLPALSDLERLWFELQREMTETGKVTRFKTTVVKPGGQREEQWVTRVGPFNLVSQGKYLNYQPSTSQVVELSRQPSSRHTGFIDDLEEAKKGVSPFALDPSRGALLSMLVRAPGLWERFQQGGVVGYLIFALLLVGLALVGERMWYLKKQREKIQDQMSKDSPQKDNPLGQLMEVFEKNKTQDLETLEIKMDEVILKSVASLERGISTIRLLAAVAPLMGLLGTVIGMISTFQSITLFGTGDPKLMAGGISQALVTTVLGLVCAIPLLLLHNWVSSYCKNLTQILQEQSLGFIAGRQTKTESPG